jgi:hypothetical protein
MQALNILISSLIVEAMGDPRASLTRRKDGENFNGRSPGRYTYSFVKRLKFIREAIDGYLLEVLTTRSFIKNDEDFEDNELRDYFSPNREEKINVVYFDINVNRTFDRSKDYQLRFGEGRLAVYVEPELARFMNSLDSKSSAGSNNQGQGPDDQAITEEDVVDLDSVDTNDDNDIKSSLRAYRKGGS